MRWGTAVGLVVIWLWPGTAPAQDLFIGGDAGTGATPEPVEQPVADRPSVEPPVATVQGSAAGSEDAGTSEPAAEPGGAGVDVFRVRGLVEPREEAIIAAEIDAQIEAIPFDDGERFARGDVLVDFDCGFYRARLSGSEATAQAARRVLETNRQLAALNSIGVLEVAQAEAAYQEAVAQARVDRVWVNRCEIEAPFAGRIIARLAEPHESVRQGQELLAILNDRDLDLRLIVPSHWLSWLEEGQGVAFRVDETGTTVPARVHRIGARIDPVSQTLPLIARIDGDPVDLGLLAGMSGTAVFDRGDEPAS